MEIMIDDSNLNKVEIEVYPSKKKNCCTAGIFCYFLVISLLIITLSLFVVWLGLQHGVAVSQAVLNDYAPKYSYSLPRQYKVPESFIIPIWNQYDRGTCWAFAATYILESQYKNQGIQQGFLQPNEFVAFSQEFLAKTMVGLCNLNPTHNLCMHSGRGKNKTAGGRVEDIIYWSKAFPEFSRSILPVSACPYQPDPLKQMECPSEADKLVENNPLEFVVEKSEITTGIQAVKNLLVKAQRPLSFSLAMPIQRYWFECSNPVVKDSEVCKYMLYPCPHNSSIYCAPKNYNIQKGSDSEMIFHPTSETMPGTGHAMVLVAYNDDFVPKRIIDFAGKPASKGGFIVRNSWGARGHSLEYLMDEISEDQENSICPNSGNVMTWTPSTKQCAKENKGDVSKCSLDIKQIYGEKIIKGAFPLKCINETHCDKDKVYALLRTDNETTVPSMKFSETGVPIAEVLEIDGSDVKVRPITTVPIQHLYYALQAEEPQKDHGERCGYVFFSYDAMQKIMSMQAQSTPSWRVIDVELKWFAKSYSRSGRNYNYSHIVNSTKKYSTFRTSHPYDILDL